RYAGCPPDPRPPGCACSCYLLLPSNAHREREPEGRALAQARLDPDTSSVHLNDAFDDGEPKAGATLGASAGAIGLLELLEDLLLIRFGNARPGVGDGDREGPVRHRHLDLHLTSVGELDGVPHQIEQHLRQPPLVAPAQWQVRGEIDLEG